MSALSSTAPRALVALLGVGLAALLALVGLRVAPGAALAAEAPFAAAPAPAERGESDLVVGMIHRPPFAWRTVDGGWRGLGVDLWQRLAGELGTSHRLVAYPDAAALRAALAAGEADVGIGLATPELASGEPDADDAGSAVAPGLAPSYPYYAGGLGVAVPSKTDTTLIDLVKLLLTPDILKIIGGLVLLLLGVGAGMWLLERRVEKEEHFGSSTTGGIGHGFWWAVVTMTGVGYGDVTPRTPAGRGIAVVWMIVSLVLIAGFTAAVTSKLTLSGMSQSITQPSDLTKVRAATVAGSAADRYLRGERVDIESLPTLDQGLERLVDEELEAVVHDRADLLHLAAGRYQNRIEVLPLVFGRQDQAFALPSASPLAEPLDRALLRLLATDEWQELQFAYLGI